jgi:enoyl-CoA hydratase/carnithine racemase
MGAAFCVGIDLTALAPARDHFSLRGSRFNSKEFFRHFAEQNQNVVASFRTYIMPLPNATGLPQNEHLFGV